MPWDSALPQRGRAVVVTGSRGRRRHRPGRGPRLRRAGGEALTVTVDMADTKYWVGGSTVATLMANAVAPGLGCPPSRSVPVCRPHS
ncbi:hypothetical protein ACFZAV_10370 [Streptomyces sp. NPDC008343]|uniref:hypothetical protein n=1 Tax=Streptomyces sp. NPDC008343 TaxID=3364828 RepID=UPI0036E37F23